MSPDVVLEEGLDATLLAVTAPLGEAEIPYMLVGALAAMAYGRPRTTDDFDLAIDIRATTVDQLETVLARSGLDVIGPSPSSFGERFKLLGGEIKGEVFISGQHPYHHREFQRRRTMRVGSERHPVMAPEDVVLRKLVNLRVRRNPNDLFDLRSVLRNQWLDLDLDYLRSMGDFYRMRLTLEAQLEEAREAREDAGLEV